MRVHTLSTDAGLLPRARGRWRGSLIPVPWEGLCARSPSSPSRGRDCAPGFLAALVSPAVSSVPTAADARPWEKLSHLL